MAKKKVAKPEDKAVAVMDEAGLPAVMDLEANAGAGFEDVTQDDMQIPFLKVLQKGSPEVDEDNTDEPCVEGAKTGMLCNSVTKELFDGEVGVLIIPTNYKRKFLHWGDRDSGGGFQGEIAPEDPILGTTQRDEKGKDAFEDGSYVSDTREHFVLVQHKNGEWEPMVMSLSSTQIKKSKRWMTVMRTLKIQGKDGLFNPPMYSQVYRLTTVPESNAKGNWRGLQIDREGNISIPALYEAAKELHLMVNEGRANAVDRGAEDDVPY